MPSAPFIYEAASLSLRADPLVVSVQPDLHASQTSQTDDDPSALLYSTFLGAGAGTDVAGAIAVDASSNAYVVGSTGSNDFPTTPGALRPSFNGGSLTSS